MTEQVQRRPVDFEVPLASSLVGQGSAVSDTSEDQTVLDARYHRFVLAQPGDGSDGPGDEEKPVSVSARLQDQGLRKKCRYGYAGEIVIAK